MVLLACGLLSLLYIVKLWEPDLWWHLATARWIVVHHAIPRVDPFSFTLHGAPWHSVDWVSDLIFYAAYRVAGYAGVTALIVLCAFALLAVLDRVLVELELDRLTRLSVITCVGLLVQVRYSIARPMCMGAVLLAVSIYLAVRWWRRRDRSVYWLVPLSAVWLPIHPTALLALVVAATLVGAAIVTRADRRDRVRAATTLGACALLLLVTRSGSDSLATALGTLSSHLATALTTEWAKPHLRDPRLWAPMLLLLIGLVGLAFERRGRLVTLGLALQGLALATRYDRNLYEGIVLCAPLFGQGLSAIAARRRPLAPLLALVVIVGLNFASQAPSRALDTNFGIGLDLRLVPKDTLELLRTLPAGRLMHDCTFGGYLIWQHVPVYCDGRSIALYSDADIERLIVPMYRGGAALEAAADRSDIRYALARFDTDFERALMRSPDWLPLELGEGSSLFVRRSRASAIGVAPLSELRFINDPAWMRAHYLPLLRDPVRRAELARDIVRGFRLIPRSPALLGIVGTVRELDPAFAAAVRAQLP